jgi:hypothetical protein
MRRRNLEYDKAFLLLSYMQMESLGSDPWFTPESRKTYKNFDSLRKIFQALPNENNQSNDDIIPINESTTTNDGHNYPQPTNQQDKIYPFLFYTKTNFEALKHYIRQLPDPGDYSDAKLILNKIESHTGSHIDFFCTEDQTKKMGNYLFRLCHAPQA